MFAWKINILGAKFMKKETDNVRLTQLASAAGEDWTESTGRGSWETAEIYRSDVISRTGNIRRCGGIQNK